MAMPQRRATEKLHAGRISVPGAVYFVTFVTEGRVPWLGPSEVMASVLAALRAWHVEGDGAILAAIVMPDHVHILFELGGGLDVGRCVSRWKSGMRRNSRHIGAWQRDFWEHRLREKESREDYGLYMLLNPYRAGLLRHDERWSGWWLPEPRIFRFASLLEDNGIPPVEWFEWPPERFQGLATGE